MAELAVAKACWDYATVESGLAVFRREELRGIISLQTFVATRIEQRR